MIAAASGGTSRSGESMEYGGGEGEGEEKYLGRFSPIWGIESPMIYDFIAYSPEQAYSGERLVAVKEGILALYKHK